MFNKKLGTYQGPLLLATFSVLLLPILCMSLNFLNEEPVLNHFKRLILPSAFIWVTMFNISGLNLKHQYSLLSKYILRITWYAYWACVFFSVILYGSELVLILACILFLILMVISGFNWYIQIKQDITKSLQ